MHRNLKTNVQKCSTITVCLTVTEKMFVLPACCFLSSLQSTADSLWQKKIKNLEFPSHVLCTTDSSLATLHLSIMQTRMLAYTHIHTHTQKMNGCMAYSHLAHTHSNRENRGGGVTGEERIEMSQERRMIQHVREELASVALYVLWCLMRLLGGSSLPPGPQLCCLKKINHTIVSANNDGITGPLPHRESWNALR